MVHRKKRSHRKAKSRSHDRQVTRNEDSESSDVRSNNDTESDEDEEKENVVLKKDKKIEKNLGDLHAPNNSDIVRDETEKVGEERGVVSSESPEIAFESTELQTQSFAESGYGAREREEFVIDDGGLEGMCEGVESGGEDGVGVIGDGVEMEEPSGVLWGENSETVIIEGYGGHQTNTGEVVITQENMEEDDEEQGERETEGTADTLSETLAREPERKPEREPEREPEPERTLEREPEREPEPEPEGEREPERTLEREPEREPELETEPEPEKESELSREEREMATSEVRGSPLTALSLDQELRDLELRRSTSPDSKTVLDPDQLRGLPWKPPTPFDREFPVGFVPDRTSQNPFDQLEAGLAPSHVDHNHLAQIERERRQNPFGESPSPTSPLTPSPPHSDNNLATPTTNSAHKPLSAPSHPHQPHSQTITNSKNPFDSACDPAQATPTPPTSPTSSDFISGGETPSSTSHQTGGEGERRVARTESLEWSVYMEENMVDLPGGVASSELALDEDYYSAEVCYVCVCVGGG